jgi:zinc protease
MFFKGPEYASRDSEVGTVMSILLGGGRSSLLARQIVDTGAATDIGFLLFPTMDPFGFLLIASVEKGGDIKACEKAIYDAIEGFKSEVPDEEMVRKARTRVEGLTILSRQTVRARAFELASAAARGDWAYADQAVENMRTVSPEEIHRVANKYLRWDRTTIGWLLPSDSDIREDDLIGSAGPPAAAGQLMGAMAAFGAMAWADEPSVPGAGQTGAGGMAMTFSDADYETLPGGVTLILKEEHTLPVVAVKAYVLAGSAYEPEGKSGLARLTAKMVGMGSRTYPYEQLYDRVEAYGSSISATSDVERAYLGTSVLASKGEAACDIVCDLLSRPAFRSKDFKRARREVLSDISQIEEDARDVAQREFRKHFYAGHPYSRPAAGLAEEVEDLTIRDVRRFYDEVWSSGGCVIAVVGDFNPDVIRPLLADRIGDWSKDAEIDLAIPPVELPTGRSRFVTTMPNKRQVKVFWGMGAPGITDPDFDDYVVMDFVFGAGAFGSRLFEKVREKEGLAYVVNSGFDPTRQPGASYVHLGTRPRNISRALDVVAEEIERIKTEEITDEEMEIAKNFIKSVKPFRMQTYSQIADRLLAIIFYDLPKDHYDTQPERIDAVTKQDVLQAAREYLDPDNSCQVIVGAVDENLEKVRPTASSSYGD